MRQRISSTVRHDLATHTDYPPIQDHVLIGDGSTAALVGVDATIRWLCLPRFDGPALLASLLDARRGAAWTVQPDRLRSATQRYVRDTAVVVTDLHAESGSMRVLEEGAFLLCTFWWVDNLAGSGRLTEARERFDRLCARVNHVGLLPEQIDPTTGDFLVDLPQAFSHIGLISSAVNLARAHAPRNHGGEASHVTRRSL